mmetsp:Transcript_16682/g.46363  ORF Transcript_16682/g.46363 Transcript_16682/m.46363 type:complete len:147 (+) Transcript_16682:50-490(+)
MSVACVSHQCEEDMSEPQNNRLCGFRIALQQWPSYLAQKYTGGKGGTLMSRVHSPGSLTSHTPRENLEKNTRCKNTLFLPPLVGLHRWCFTAVAEQWRCAACAHALKDILSVDGSRPMASRATWISILHPCGHPSTSLTLFLHGLE